MPIFERVAILFIYCDRDRKYSCSEEKCRVMVSLCLNGTFILIDNKEQQKDEQYQSLNGYASDAE